MGPAQPQTNETPDGRIFLKVKIKSLAEEARIIRKAEKKGVRRESLRFHRISVVRDEARHSQLAYAFVRGRTYAATEQSASAPEWKKVEAMVEKFAGTHQWCTELRYCPNAKETRARLQQWKAQAELDIAQNRAKKVAAP